MKLDALMLDRAAGVLLGQACGDALGVPYEFRPPLREDEQPRMIGGGLGPYAPGEFSDDTQMAVCIADVAATGADLRTEAALDGIGERFLDWYAGGATDVGNQTRTVLTAARGGSGPAGRRLTVAARALHEGTGHTAGNGALMRTGVVALPYLGDDEAIAAAARAVAELTHADPLAGDSCVLWCVAVDRAVREQRLDGVHDGLALLPAARRDQWAAWLDAAAQQSPHAFSPNGFTVTALQAALSAIWHTATPEEDPAAGSFACQHLQHALATAVRAGDDTDTVAAIAGALLGARWGASAVPFNWGRSVHGWPHLRGRDLQRLAVLAARHGQPDAQGWPAGGRLDYHEPRTPVIAHPADDQVLLGTANPSGADGVTAVVSLCRLGTGEVPRAGVAASDHLEVWLVDSPTANAHPTFVLDDAARTVAALREEGKTVLLHCVRAEMRTPAIAAPTQSCAEHRSTRPSTTWWPPYRTPAGTGRCWTRCGRSAKPDTAPETVAPARDSDRRGSGHMTQMKWLHSHLRQCLQEMWETCKVNVDDDGDVPFCAGSAAGWISVVPGEPPLVRVSAHAAFGVKGNAAVLRELNEFNRRSRTAHVYWYNGVVVVEQTMHADGADVWTLEQAFTAVCAVANDLGPMLAAVHGGMTPFPADEEPADECEAG